jgi:hypothetical protein
MDFYLPPSKKLPELIIDGIPLCHLNNRNRIFYLYYRSKKEYDKNELDENILSIDIDLFGNTIISNDTKKWNSVICRKLECKYLSVCRLNTLLKHKEYLKDWINE